ncbi:MAG: hypothetical protein ABF315_04170 [Lentimonas sp.]
MPEIADHEESVLLSSNSALDYKIKLGTHEFITDLGGPMHVSRYFVNNQSAAGEFTLFASNTLEFVDSKNGAPISTSVAFLIGVIPSVTFQETKTRYLLLRLDITHDGTIGNLGGCWSTFQHTSERFQHSP